MRPNFVIIITDTQATNVVECYGHPGMETPQIDQLAARGIKFTQAYTTCPLCTPARAGLLSGMYAHSAGPWTNNLPFGDNVKTMGQRFQDVGYHTAYAGKWHLDGHDYFGTGICPPGWDSNYWFDGKRYLAELTEEEILLWRKGLNSVEELKRHQIKAEFTWAHRVSNRAIEFLKNINSKPFLLVVSYDEPHHPYTCPPEYAEKFQNFDYNLGAAGFDTLMGKPSHQKEWARSFGESITGERVRHPLYFGCNSYVDHEIGRVIAATHQYSPGNTYIIYTSDHGDMLGAHQLRGKGPAAYQEITNIPLIIEQPGNKGAGTVNRTPVSHIDLLPTLLELAGERVVPVLEGCSITRLLEGQEEPDRAVVIEFNRYEIEHDSFGGFQPLRCIVEQRFKLVINLLSEDELYDLENDPAEVVNLINDDRFRDMRDTLHDRLLDWMYEKRDPFRGATWERRPWRKARKLAWRGKFRPRPDDGYAPQVLDYDTGLPTKGVKVEFGQSNVDRLEK